MQHAASVHGVHALLDQRFEFAFTAMRGDTFLALSRTGANVVTIPKESWITGHIWEDTENALSQTAYLVDVPLGSGHVVLFANDPTWRAYWRGLDRLLLAAILFLTAM